MQRLMTKAGLVQPGVAALVADHCLTACDETRATHPLGGCPLPSGSEIEVYTRRPRPINTDGEITTSTQFRVIPCLCRFGSWLTLTFHFSSHAFEIFSRHKVAAGTVSESTSEPG